MARGSEPALRLDYRFALSSGELVFEMATLRRPELVLRFTRARNISADERMITRSFPLARDPSRLVARAMTAGVIEVEAGLVHPGESMLLDLAALGGSRAKNACHLDLDWASSDARHPTPSRLGSAPVAEIAAIGEMLLDRTSDQRATLAKAFDFFRSIGAPLTLSVDALDGEPTDRERRFARGLEAQFESLAVDVPNAFNMGDSLSLSDRQIQRLFERFSARYAINARSWRDARNRWRVQNAALLLSRPELTVADVAREVGYASPNALARAFAKAGFLAPAALRQELSRMSERDPLS